METSSWCSSTIIIAFLMRKNFYHRNLRIDLLWCPHLYCHLIILCMEYMSAFFKIMIQFIPLSISFPNALAIFSPTAYLSCSLQNSFPLLYPIVHFNSTHAFCKNNFSSGHLCIFGQSPKLWGEQFQILKSIHVIEILHPWKHSNKSLVSLLTSFLKCGDQN